MSATESMSGIDWTQVALRWHPPVIASGTQREYKGSNGHLTILPEPTDEQRLKMRTQRDIGLVYTDIDLSDDIRLGDHTHNRRSQR